MFGKTFQKSVKELMAAGVAFALLLLAYAQLGFLVSTPVPLLTEGLLVLLLCLFLPSGMT